ncbi:helix-turn-helix domain-containing protein [Listeria costaricensis]|uniref:helix-turn-helix domain-containing protein n=1 Tax=Listeria costaricensis TaxID=2026604 RepID=UPI000C088C12|nr:helix-turn-helix transcriptional regulator [Listeria costaricensis]
MVKFHEKLIFLREKQGWTKVETARRLGLKTSSTYGNWEYGIREPDLETVTQIAHLFDVTIDYLLGEDQPAPESVPQNEATDIKYQLEKVCEDIQLMEDPLFGGMVLSDPAALYLVDSIRFTSQQAERINLSREK